MAIPKDKKQLFDSMIPEVDFIVSSKDVKITSSRLHTARVVDFDAPGKCKACKSSDLELDHLITPEGIHLYSNRMKGAKYVAFDEVRAYPDHCFFRIRARGHTYMVQHHKSTPAADPIDGSPTLTMTPAAADVEGQDGGVVVNKGQKRRRQQTIDEFLQPKMERLEENTLDEYVFRPVGLSNVVGEVITLGDSSDDEDGGKENEVGTSARGKEPSEAGSEPLMPLGNLM